MLVENKDIFDTSNFEEAENIRLVALAKSWQIFDKKWIKDVISRTKKIMSDAPNYNGDYAKSSNPKVQFQENEEGTVEALESASLAEESCHDIYDFFTGNRMLFQFGSEEVESGLRRSIEQTETIYVFMTIPPDGGWGWVIVAISFICNSIVDGICLTFGRIMADLAKDLKLDIGKVITISSVMSGVYFLVGPVVSAIANKVGFRAVAVSGGVVSAIGILAGSYCKTWIGLVMCYGFIAGWGFGMVFAPATIVVGYYFEKYRALVTGIAICGSGFGTLVFSPLFGAFVEKYGWRNTFRLQCGLCIVVSILSFLFRPLIPIRVAQIKEPESSRQSDADSEQSVELAFASYSKFNPTLSKDTDSIKTSATLIIERNAPIVQHLKRYDPAQRRHLENCCGSLWKKMCYKCCKKIPPTEKPMNEIHRDLNLVLETRPLFRRDIFYQRSVAELLDSEQVQDLRMSIMRPPGVADDPTARMNYTVSMMHHSKKIKPPAKCLKFASVIFEGLILLLDIRLFGYTTFQLMALNCFFFVVGSNIPYMFITSRGDDNGIPKKFTNWLISIIGVSNTVFRLIAGLTSFVPRIDLMYLSASVQLLCGLFTFISGFVGQMSIGFQYIFCIIFGIGSAYFNTLKQVIFVKCLGLDNLTNAFGISALVMGIATLVGMPIAGILIDATGDTNATFMYAGISIIVAGVMQAFVPLCLKRQQAKKEEQRLEAEAQAMQNKKRDHSK